MNTETPNRAAADLLAQDLLAAHTREEILGSPLPVLILSHSGRSVLFASHAFARRLGLPDGAALMRAGLPRLVPGTARLEALAQEPPPERRLERLRFGLGTRPTLLNTLVAPLALSDGTPALLVSLIEAHPTLPVEIAPLRTEAAPPPPAAPVPAPITPPAPRPNRFVFSLSREGWIESLSPAFGQALGLAPETLTGQAMASVAGALDRHAGEAIEKAVAAGATWGGIRLNWPLPNEGRAVPVVLSAMPLHGESGLTGFSGFGRCLFDEASPLGSAAPASPPPVSDVPAAAEVSPPEPISPDLEKAIAAFADDDDEAMPPRPPATQPEAEVEVETPAPEATPEPVTAQAETQMPEVPEPKAPEPAEPEPALPEAALPNAEVQESAQQDGANVVSLRPGQLDLPPGLPPHLSRPGLSMSERNAFREIARALGAKFEPDTDGATGALPPTPPAAETTPEATAEAAATGSPVPEEAATRAPQAPEPRGETHAAMPSAFLVDHLPIGVLVMREQSAIFVNRTLLDLAGYEDFDTFTAQDGLRALFRKGALPKEREDGFDTVVLTTRSGELLPVDAHVQPLEWDGAPAALISMRRAVELEQGKALTSVAHDLKRVNALAGELRAVLDTATDGVITLDESGTILSLNGAAEALFGLSQNEVAGQSFTQLLLNESHAEALDYFEGLKANGVKSVLNDGREVSGREKKGGRIPLFLTFGRISDEEPKRYCAVLRDLTTWKRAEGELQEARRAAESASAKKSDFLAKVGHEIRTPMNAIIGFAEVMQEERLGPVGNAKYKEYLGDIRSSGLHVVSLVNDLLDLSKIEAGRMELNFGATDLNAIVSGCVGIIQPQATQLRVLVRTQLAAKLPPVVADERSIRQILLNLLSNATRFTPSGGQVLVATVLQDSGEAVIRIRDTGVGMSSSEIEQALESYRQVGPRRDHGGTGLGLPLSKALTEANRANFSIRSVPGEGTTVEISFPPTRVLAE